MGTGLGNTKGMPASPRSTHASSFAHHWYGVLHCSWGKWCHVPAVQWQAKNMMCFTFTEPRLHH